MKFAIGVNLRPALPWAKVMKSPLVIGVVPSFWNSVPFVDVRDLEVRHLRAVRSIAADDEARRRLRVLVGRWRSSPTACRPPLDRDRRRDDAAAEACVGVAGRRLHVEAAGAEEVGRGRELQAGIALRERDERRRWRSASSRRSGTASRS